jgi:hypothetical protein
MIVYCTVLFRRGASLWGEVHWFKDAKTDILVEYYGNCEATCVPLKDDRLCWVKVLVDWWLGECLLELLECELCCSGPFSFAWWCHKHVGTWCHYLAVFADEPLVVLAMGSNSRFGSGSSSDPELDHCNRLPHKTRSSKVNIACSN